VERHASFYSLNIWSSSFAITSKDQEIK